MAIPSIKELKAIPLFAHLHLDELRSLANQVQERTYTNRKILFAEGARCEGLFIVKAGQVKLLRSSQEKEQLLAILSQHEPLDLVPFLDAGPHTVTARARGLVSVYFIDPATARELIWNTPPLLTAVMTTVSARLRNLATIATDLAFKDVTARICKILLDQARAEGKQYHGGIRIERTLSQREFASMVGTVREVAWRSLKKLEDDGLLKIDRDQITLLDIERLAAMA
jgi:CRP-like cAMP-binding protein